MIADACHREFLAADNRRSPIGRADASDGAGALTISNLPAPEFAWLSGIPIASG